MKRVFRTNKTTVIFSWAMTIIFFLVSFFMFFIVKDVNIGKKLLAFFVTLFAILFTVDTSTYKLIINDKSIISKNNLYYTLFFFLFSPKTKYIAYNLDEIKKVNINATLLFEEVAWIDIFSKDISRRKLPLMIPFISGIPASAVKEILSHIPKDAEVRIDPALKKYIDNPKKMYRYNITLGIIILVIVAIWTFWIFTFHNPLKGQKLDFRKAWQQTIEKSREKYK